MGRTSKEAPSSMATASEDKGKKPAPSSSATASEDKGKKPASSTATASEDKGKKPSRREKAAANKTSKTAKAKKESSQEAPTVTKEPSQEAPTVTKESSQENNEAKLDFTVFQPQMADSVVYTTITGVANPDGLVVSERDKAILHLGYAIVDRSQAEGRSITEVFNEQHPGTAEEKRRDLAELFDTFQALE